MRYSISINLDNDAFHNGDGEHDPGYEVTRILHRIIEHETLHRELPMGTLFDMNGNTVGEAVIYDGD